MESWQLKKQREDRLRWLLAAAERQKNETVRYRLMEKAELLARRIDRSDRHCPGCWNVKFPSPPVSYGEGAAMRYSLCGDCDRDLIEMHGLVWDENGDEWSYHPSQKCPFCGAAIVSEERVYADDAQPEDNYLFTEYRYACEAEVAYGGDAVIIDAQIDTGVLCEEGLRYAHAEDEEVTPS